MKTYKFKLYSNHGNRELHKTIDSHAQVWNHFVALCRRYYGIYGNYPGKKLLMRHLTKLKRLSRYAHWNLLSSQSLQDVIDRLDKAYTKMFADRKSGSVPVSHALSNGSDTSLIPSNKRVGNYYRVTIFVSASGYTAISRAKKYLAHPNAARLSGTALETYG